MKTSTRTPLRSRTHGQEKIVTMTVPVPGEHVQRRQLEKSVSLTGPERLRSRWYRLRLTVQEMNYATRRLVCG